MESVLLGVTIIAINVAISLFIRYLDRNNNSLEKVRRYSEKVIDDFNTYVTNRTNDLQNITTELEVAKKEGNVLAKRLNSLSSDFMAKAQGLEGRMNAIKELENRVVHSEDEMQKLMNMAKLAEKNIAQVSKEVDFIDSLAKQVASAKDELDLLNSSIPEMQKHFTNIAHEQLESYKGKILSDVEEAIKNIEARLSVAEESATTLLDDASKKLDETYNAAFEEARKKSHTLEDDAFENLQKLAEKRMLDTRTLFNESLSKTKESMTEKLSDVEKEAEAFRKEYINKINDYSTTLTNDLSNAEIALNENVAQIKVASENFNQDMHQSINNNIQSMKDEIANFSHAVLKEIESIKAKTSSDVLESKGALEAFKAEWNSELENYKSSLRGSFSNLELLLKNNIDEIKDKELHTNFELKEYIDSNNKALKEEVHNVSTSLKADIENDKAYVDEFKKSWEMQVSSFVERIKHDFEETERDINNKSSLLIQKMNEAEKALKETASYLENEFKNGEKNSTEQMKTMLLGLQANIDELSHKADKKILSFNELFEMRFKKFENLISGTDVMQEELEKAIENTKTKIKEEFEHSATILKLEQQTFAKNFDSEMEKLSIKLNDIDSNVELLKSKAVENVSEKLSLFEKDFLNSLTKRGDEINFKLETLKADVSEKLQLLSSEKEAERREIEDAYKGELKDRVAKLELEYQGQFAGLDQKVQNIESDLSKRVSTSDESIIKHAENLKQEIDVALEKARQYMDKELTDYKVGLKDSLSSHYFDLEDAAKELKDKIEETKASSNAEFEAIKKGFELWKNSMEQEFDSSKSLFEDKIKGMENVTSDAMKALKDEYDGHYNELLAKNEALFNDFKEKVNELNDVALIAQVQFKKDAEALSTSVEGKLKEAFASIEQKVQEANHDTSVSVDNIREVIHKLRENLDEIQEKATLKIQADATRLNKIIEEIDEKQNAFITQTRVFEKADQLKLDLEKSIEKLKGEVSRFDVYKQAMDEINNQYARVCKMEEEIEEKISTFMNERGRIEKIEKEFSKLDDISNNIDRKIEALRNTGDNIQTFEVQVRKVEESITKVNTRYERLEKKEVVLEQTAESIGVAFEQLKVLEGEIKTFKSDISTMPSEIANLKTSMQALMFNKDKADSVFEKLVALDEMLGSMDSKISKLQDSRSWLASVETRLTELSSSTDEKLKMLSSLYKGTPSQHKESGAPALNTRESVLSLHKQGWKVDEIANALKLSKGEVDLIIEYGDRVM